MTFEQFKKSICDKDPQVKWALDLIDEEVKEALQQQREEIMKEALKVKEKPLQHNHCGCYEQVLDIINP